VLAMPRNTATAVARIRFFLSIMTPSRAGGFSGLRSIPGGYRRRGVYGRRGFSSGSFRARVAPFRRLGGCSAPTNRAGRRGRVPEAPPSPSTLAISRGCRWLP
jgi:hypothetical protein